MSLNRRQLLSAAITIGAAAATTAVTPARAGGKVVAGSDWMSAIDDARTIDDLTIPGTHNTCASVGGPFDTAKCQDWSLPEQLDAGVRFLDIRCRLHEGAFTIHHGPVYQNKNFTDVLTDCRDFLAARPYETIVMSLQQEYSEASHEEFAAVFNDRYMTDEDFDAMLFREARIPALGQVRGKVVLIANSDHIAGIPAKDTSLLWYQNDWEAPTARKWDLIRDHLAAAESEHPDTTRLFVNYTSTTTGELIPNPRNYAQELNPRTLSHAAEAVDAGHRPVYGAVVMDFAGTVARDLVPTLLRCNAGVDL